ncbi:hypothetical protein SAMN05216559_1989 [Halomicrobium zhouii]|uniref:Uncharacterized protein n=1 Tax=Halomicrobium zhouii TaxID=767519 RepID=A0A1I6L437_9EURY|nr:EF-hand domain-containing protein [Halomicrobium zhouii]SFR98187.1 hypothetical protein SAMN05216559_1989 [Halomicrobium zhouii]
MAREGRERDGRRRELGRRSFLNHVGVGALGVGVGVGIDGFGSGRARQESDPLPWTATFERADGTTDHDGESAWHVESADSHPSFAVRSGALTATETAGDARWLSEPIDVSGADAVDVAVELRGSGPLWGGPAPVVGTDPPTDPDADGIYEDVTGDGRLDDEDVGALFEALDDENVTDDAAAFDGNCNGRVDYNDVVRLARAANGTADRAHQGDCGRPADELAVSYVLDGVETVVATFSDDASADGETVSATGLTGQTLRVVVTARTTDPATAYHVDAVEVTATGDDGGQEDGSQDEGGQHDGDEGTDGAADPTLFYEDFESGSMADEETLALESNESGFVWHGNNRTAVVEDEWPDGGRVVWHNEPRDEFVEGADYRTRDGSRSLRFRYPPEESWAEQRFTMNREGTGYDEVWIGYWIRVPHNFSHASGSGSPSNNKWLAVWMDGYSQKGTGATAVFNTWSSFDHEEGAARATISASNAGGAGHHRGIDDFILPSRDRGRWMYTVHRLVTSSERGAADGTAHWWRRWEDAEEFELVKEVTDYVFDPPSDPEKPQGWNKGYLMGWTNPNYAEETEFLIDQFALSTEPLVDDLP